MPNNPRFIVEVLPNATAEGQNGARVVKSRKVVIPKDVEAFFPVNSEFIFEVTDEGVTLKPHTGQEPPATIDPPAWASQVQSIAPAVEGPQDI